MIDEPQRPGGCGRLKVQAAVRPGRLAVAQKFGQDPAQLVLAPDQDPVKALGAHGTDPSFGVHVGTGRQLHPTGTVSGW